MIGSVAIQRLLETAILLKLERGTRGSETQSSTPKQSVPGATAQQPGSQPQSPRGAHFTQASTWINAPVIPAEAPPAAAVASAVREAAVAPLAYRETVSDGALPGARTLDQTPPPSNAVPAPIQYAQPELALALSRTKPGTLGIEDGATAGALPDGASQTEAKREERATLRQAKLMALIAGSAVMAATLAILIFG